MNNLKLKDKERFEYTADLKTPIGKYRQLKIRIEYHIGGYNYFSGSNNPRAYRLSFTPCNVSNGFTESTMLGKDQKETGYYMLIEKTNRFNSKRLSSLASYIDPFVNDLANAYIEDNHTKMKKIISFCEPKEFIAKPKKIEKLSEVNECEEERPVNKPYEIWEGVLTKAPLWTWKVLKKYESPAEEAKNPQARWLCAVYSPITKEQCQPEGYEIGDVYVKDIKENAIKKVR